MKSIQSVILIVLDGWGLVPAWGGNAITSAKTPFVHQLAQSAYAVLEAAGTKVGLTAGTLGNSEVGHLHLGAGRIVRQTSTLISEAITHQRLATNPVLVNLLATVTKHQTTLHLVGLISRATVHADLQHLYALLNLLDKLSVPQIRLHLFTDGRDSEPRAGLGLVMEVEHYLKKLPTARIVSLAGRYYAMDRDEHWNRTELAFRALVAGRGIQAASARDAIAQAYRIDQTDEFIEPTIIADPEHPVQAMAAHDGVIFFNFRADRMRQLIRAIADPVFSHFLRPDMPHPLNIVTLADYGTGLEDKTLQSVIPSNSVAYPLARVIADAGLAQIHMAETEKYAHVTYFFNGGRETPFPLEERVMLPSPDVTTYDQLPEMAAAVISRELQRAIQSSKYSFLVANFANADMVGHTGNFRATLRAVETIDHELSLIAAVARRKQIPLLISADHGNAEEMVNPMTGDIDTQHTVNPVPCYFWGVPDDWQLDHARGSLIDVAPTILTLLELPRPNEMTGRSLLRRVTASETIS